MKQGTPPGNTRNSKSWGFRRGFSAAVAGMLFLGLITPENAQARTGAFGNQPQIVWMLRNS